MQVMHIYNVLALLSIQCPDLLHQFLSIEFVGSTLHQHDDAFAGHRVGGYYDDYGKKVSADRVTDPCLRPNVNYDGRYDHTNRHYTVAHHMKHCRVNIDIPIHKLFLSFNRSFFGVFTLLIVNNTLSLLWGLTYFLWVVAAILWLVRMLVLENRSTRAIVCFVALMLVVVVFCATVIVVALATMLVTVTLVVMLLIAVIIMVVTFMIMTVTFVVVTVVTFMAMFVNIVVVTVTVVMIMSAAIVILASQMVVSVPRVQDFDLDQVEDETNDRHNKHRESFHLRRLIKSMRSLDDQPNSHYPHRRNRDHSSDNFCSVPPIRQRVSLTLLR
jgi:hypothetical protein